MSRKVLLTTILIIMLSLSIAQVAFAMEVDVDNEDSLRENLESGNIIKLTVNINVQNILQIENKQNITIDLKGFKLTSDNKSALFSMKYCTNIKIVDSSEEKTGTIEMKLTSVEGYDESNPYIAVKTDKSTVSMENIKINSNSTQKKSYTQFFNLSNQSELQLISCDITANTVGKVIKADNSKVYLGKNNQEL